MSGDEVSVSTTRSSLILVLREWLWTAAVKPIFAVHGLAHCRRSLEETTSQAPGGWTSSCSPHFPFHATGCCDGMAPGESAMALVISTYLPTIKSLLYAGGKATIPSRGWLRRRGTTPPGGLFKGSSSIHDHNSLPASPHRCRYCEDVSSDGE
ncbi:hypothetical protein VTI74DRAFT_1849 [Chaetomium olivicolor]